MLLPCGACSSLHALGCRLTYFTFQLDKVEDLHKTIAEFTLPSGRHDNLDRCRLAMWNCFAIFKFFSACDRCS